MAECHDETVCSWSQWFNVTYPDDNGEFETYEAIKKKGYKICEKPSNISCRALSFPLTPLEELDTSVKCDVNFGLICNNAEEEDGHCYNYEIQVYCCEESTCTTTSSPSVTSPTITESVVTTISPTTTSLTQTTTPVITTTEFTTEETTQTSIVSTVPLSPTSTPMESTTTPIIVTQSVTTVTVSETPESSSTTPSITPCTPGKICNWSEWINVSSPKPDGDEYETYEEIRKNGYKICEKPENISCRSIKYPDNSMDSQNLTCDVQTGLTCYNKDQEGLQSFPICEDHEIRVYCCEEIICPIFSTPSTTITETFYTTITMATTQIHPTTEQTTEEITSTTTEATSTIPHTMSTEPPVWIRTFTTMIPTVTEQPQQNQTHESTTVLIPSVTSTTPEQTTSETSLSETTSIVTTEPPTSIPEFTISTLCHCLFDGKLYPPGVTITDGAANRTLCYTVICKDDCTLYIHQWSCETPTTPEVTSTTTISESTTTMTTELTSTSELTTPEKTTHSPESTLESTTTIQLISSRTTIPEYTTSNITEGCLLDPPRKHGEVWKLYNCTMARCLENKTIEIFKTQCVTPPPIKCVNGFSPDLVPDADGCCQHWECRCVCLGWGDPHYKTFDGTSYAYQGSCTYVLVEEINKKIPNFGIYIDNYECGNQVSCPRSIIVHYEDQKIQIKVISIPPPVLEVNVNGQLVGLPYNKEAIKIFVSGIFTRVYILTLNATISFSGVDYRVELPYQRFSNNTQGQCGTCTNNKTDDCMLPDGKIISNCEIMAASWIVNTTDKPGCLPIPPSTPTPPPTCIPSSLCELIKGPTFQECHNKLNPDDYYKACIFDSCRAPNISIECSSLQRYASLCIDEGICIDWRSKAPACRISCPSPKVYQPCGPAVTYTCKTTPEEKEANKNNTSMVEGCFCPNGTMLFSNAIDICTKDCGCIGLDNIPRKFGERFQLDCHDCICLEGGRGISCEKHQCPDVTNTCPLEGFYPVTQISSSDKCCNETKCYCDTSRCSNNIPNCTLGYEAKSVTPAGHCCPKYECVPKHVCVHENAEYQPGSQVYSGKCETCDCPIHGNISENIKIICHPVHCDLHCLAGYTLDYNSGDCCPRCIQTHCVLNDDGSTHLLKPGEILNKKNDNCTVYNCSENFILTSSNIICQEFFEADCEPGTIQYLPDGCCKTCERKNNSCTLQLSEDYLTYNNCRSLEKVQMSQCEGFCETFSKYSADAKSMQHKCSCCKEVRTSQKEVKMQCKDGSEVPYNYTYVEECNCVTNACDRVQSKRDTYRKEKRPKKTTLNV
ncbi:intestinal mucin-like protein [Rhinophrynus dorsalis]